MICPKCGTMLNNDYPFCTECGAPLSTKKEKKGSLWPPLIFMVIMMVVGITFFLAYPAETPATPLANAPWFLSKDGEVTFDPKVYEGSPELTVPDGVTALAEDCFYNCDQLHTVLLPDSLSHIGNRAFADCGKIRGIKLPEGVTQIGECAFQGCDELEAIAIPVTVKTIGNGAFDDCSALRHIFFEGTKAQWTSLYSGKFGTGTTIYCVDGSIAQENPDP